MRLLVAGAMYLASGALFSTIETVAGENPLCVATSLIVTAWFFSLGRFTRRAPRKPASSRHTHSLYNRRAVVGRDLVYPEERNSRPSRFRCLATLLRRHFERQRLAEPARLPNSKYNPGDHPDAPDDLRRAAKAQPQSQANNETKHRRDEIPRLFLLRTQEIAHESRGIHTHKGN